MRPIEGANGPTALLVYLLIGVAILARDMAVGPGMPVNLRHSRVFWSVLLGFAAAAVLAWPLVIGVRLLRRTRAGR